MTRLSPVISAPLGGGSPSTVTESSAVVHPPPAGSVDTTAYRWVMSSRKAKIPECSRPLGPQNQSLAGTAIDASPCCRATSRRPLHWWIGGCGDLPAWISRSASKPGTASSPAANTPACARCPRVIPGPPHTSAAPLQATPVESLQLLRPLRHNRFRGYGQVQNEFAGVLVEPYGPLCAGTGRELA